jgi:transposase
VAEPHLCRWRLWRKAWRVAGALDKTGERTIEIIERSDTAKRVESLPRRRVVEHTFARPGRCRREAKDVEATIKSAVARITIASIRLMISRLART